MSGALWDHPGSKGQGRKMDNIYVILIHRTYQLEHCIVYRSNVKRQGYFNDTHTDRQIDSEQHVLKNSSGGLENTSCIEKHNTPSP